MMKSALRALKPGVYTAEDFLDGDGVTVGVRNEPLKIRVRIKINRDRAEVDFSGSAPQCAGNVNAVEAIAISAVYYVFRCLLTEDVPATSGLIRPIRVIAPRRNNCECHSARRCCGRKRGNIATHGRHLIPRAGQGRAFAHPRRKPGHHEQFHARRPRPAK